MIPSAAESSERPLRHTDGVNVAGCCSIRDSYGNQHTHTHTHTQSLVYGAAGSQIYGQLSKVGCGGGGGGGRQASERATVDDRTRQTTIKFTVVADGVAWRGCVQLACMHVSVHID